MDRENTKHSWAEPWKIKMVEHLKMTTREQRKTYIEEAGYNTFLLRSEDVYIDLLTDSGTSAMSDQQWAAMMMGDEAYAGSKSFYRMVDVIREHYGYKWIVPTHQGRGAEHLLSKALIKQGDSVPGNMYFTTTRLHQELAGGQFVDVIMDEAHEPDVEYPFKGNVDLIKLEHLIKKVGAEKIPYISLECNVNMAGGQPVSMENIKALYALCQAQGIPVMLDATRAAENSYFIKMREKGYADKSVKEILREICDHTDGCTMSAKKDCLTNIGGFFACNDQTLYQNIQNQVVIYEGLHTYGGMAGRDMAALAQGIIESVQDDHQHARIGQVRYLGKKLLEAGVPIVVPVGGHAVFIDVRRFLSRLDQDEFPAQALAAELYVHAGIRAMERGNVSAGRDPATGKNRRPKLELVRLTLPRRVYTQAHMDVVAEAVMECYQKRDEIRGLAFTYEPEHLRFFQSRFRKI